MEADTHQTHGRTAGAVPRDPRARRASSASPRSAKSATSLTTGWSRTTGSWEDELPDEGPESDLPPGADDDEPAPADGAVAAGQQGAPTDMQMDAGAPSWVPPLVLSRAYGSFHALVALA